MCLDTTFTISCKKCLDTIVRNILYSATVWWVLLVLVIQMACCKLFFTTNDSTILNTVIIDNRSEPAVCTHLPLLLLSIIYRRLFNLFSYTVFLYNIVTGAMAAVIRLLLSFFVMIIILPRMDRLMFVKGFEKIDIGQWCMHFLGNNACYIKPTTFWSCYFQVMLYLTTLC